MDALPAALDALLHGVDALDLVVLNAGIVDDAVAFGQARKHGGVAPVPAPDLDRHPFDAIPIGAEYSDIETHLARAVRPLSLQIGTAPPELWMHEGFFRSD
mgnify:CR=1 FL=1